MSYLTSFHLARRTNPVLRRSKYSWGVPPSEWDWHPDDAKALSTFDYLRNVGNCTFNLTVCDSLVFGFYIIIISGDSCIIIVVIKLLFTSTFGTQDARFTEMTVGAINLKLPIFRPATHKFGRSTVHHTQFFLSENFYYTVASFSLEITTEVHNLILTLPTGSCMWKSNL